MVQHPLIATAFNPGQFPPPQRAEIVMVGRSNVGKSSVINRLLGSCVRGKNVKGARVSQKPGCTRSINFYKLSDRTTLVDLPGFGYAQMSRNQQEGLRELIEKYFEVRGNIALVVHLVDARLPLQPLDWKMLEWSKHFIHPYLLTLNKCDKVSRLLLTKRKREIQALSTEMSGRMEWMDVSARTGQGISELRRRLEAAGKVV